MSDDKTRLEQAISTLKRQRDELALQIHLGAAEAKEEFDVAQTKLDSLTADFDPLKEAVETSGQEVFAAMQLVGEEVLGSFERIRKSLQ